MIVLKFGGKTIGTSEALSRSLDVIEDYLDRRPIVVVSAHGDTTDLLLAAADRALSGEIKTGQLREYHLELARAHGVAPGMIEPLLTRLEALLHGIALLKELTPRTRDHVLSFGERLASRIVAGAINARGHRALPVNAYDVGLITDSTFGNAVPLAGIDTSLRDHLAVFEADVVPVVTGFIAKDEAGEITTLGRSGSDYTATILASAVGAEEVIVCKSVDGVMTADPSIDSRARNIPWLSFEEASELAYFGAEVLHPSTLIPAMKREIPVRVINVNVEGDPGTVIVANARLSASMAKSVAYKEGVTLFHLESQRLHSVPEVLTQALELLRTRGIVAHMITTSEAGISLITQSGLSPELRHEAMEALSAVADVTVVAEQAIICVVGDELRGKAHAVGQIFTALAEAGINPRAVTRSASEINVAFLVHEHEIAHAVKAVHGLIVK